MRQKMLLILNDPPYGTERSYNGLRLAGSMSRTDDAEVRVFLMGDAVGCAAADQKVPEGYYYLDRMIESVARHGGEIGCSARVWTRVVWRRTGSPRARTAPRSRSSPRGRSGRTRS